MSSAPCLVSRQDKLKTMTKTKTQIIKENENNNKTSVCFLLFNIKSDV